MINDLTGGMVGTMKRNWVNPRRRGLMFPTVDQSTFSMGAADVRELT